MLDSRSRSLKEDDKDNIIALISCYQWRTNVYFVFPFVDGDLNQVLRQGWTPPGVAEVRDPALPEYWLWKQIGDVCEALETIHTGLTNHRDERKVIAFHFDLKPANLLVTWNGILKITDFGQSLIQVVDDGEEATGEYTTGDFVYQAPESKPSREVLEAARADMVSSHPHARMVFLNYDIWPVACIMTEILTNFYNTAPDQPPTACQRLDLQRKVEGPSDAYYGIAEGKPYLKRCVTDTLEAFRRESPHDYALQKYTGCIVDLILSMFRIDPALRIHSDDVVEALAAASTVYDDARKRPDDKVFKRMKERGLSDEEGFVELGWLRDSSMTSFLELCVLLQHRIGPL